jgi:hypothetical protein
LNPSDCGPPALIVYSAGNDGGEVRDGSEGHDSVFVSVYYDGPPVFEVENALERVNVLGGLVRIG